MNGTDIKKGDKVYILSDGYDGYGINEIIDIIPASYTHKIADICRGKITTLKLNSKHGSVVEKEGYLPGWDY